MRIPSALGHRPPLLIFHPPLPETIVQYYWQFGDGQVSWSANPIHLYSTYGTFNVTLQVTTNHGCIGDVVKTVMVISPPAAAFSYTSPACAMSDSIEFVDQSSSPSGTIVRWEWDFGDGQSETVLAPANPNVYHTYYIAGTFNVTLTIHTSDSCAGQKTNSVTIIPQPIPDFSYSVNRCESTPVQFTDLSLQNGGGAIKYLGMGFR